MHTDHITYLTITWTSCITEIFKKTYLSTIKCDCNPYYNSQVFLKKKFDGWKIELSKTKVTGSVLKPLCVNSIRIESKECTKKESLQQHAYLLTGTWTSPSSEKLTSDSVCPRTRGWPLSKQAWRNLTACRARVSTPNLLFCDSFTTNEDSKFWY